MHTSNSDEEVTVSHTVTIYVNKIKYVPHSQVILCFVPDCYSMNISTGFFIILLHILLYASGVERNVMCGSEDVDHLAVIGHMYKILYYCTTCNYALVGTYYGPSGSV